MNLLETTTKKSLPAESSHPASIGWLQFLKPAIVILMAWGFLNILLNLRYPAPQESLWPPLLVSPEVLLIVAVLCLAAWFKWPYDRTLIFSLTLLFIFLRLFRSADALVPIYFFRPFNLYIDAPFLGVLIRFLFKTLPLNTFLLYSATGVFLMITITVGIWWSLKALHQVIAQHKKGRVIVSAIVALLTAQLFFPSILGFSRLPVFHPGIAQRIVEEIDFLLHVRGVRNQNLEDISETAARLEKSPSSLDKLGGANVYIIFVESYGQTLFDNEQHIKMILPVWRQYEQDLENRGFTVRSGFFKSPAFGGSSWLAHGTIASGVNLSDQLKYDLLITSQNITIAPIFERAGYRTISVMPANEIPWPQGKFFGYQKHYYARDFEYRGPRFGWSPMADQYVLESIYRNEILPRRQPLFIEFVLINSHAPFNHQPPYLEDWSQIGDGSIYHQKDAVTFPVVWPHLADATEAFVSSIIYEMTVIKSFIEHYIDDKTLIIIMGDHQPTAQITGPDSGWSVPVHMISRNKKFLEPFENKGYTPGLVPEQIPPHPGMETFLIDFLKAFSTE